MLALSSINKIRDGVPASSFATSTCLNPKRVRIRMSETGDYTDIYCDCGKCLRCQDAKRDAWASRMFLHSLDYEYAYFVTLTYGSYNLLPFSSHPFLNDWIMTVPSYDFFNMVGKPCWTPSVLCQSHLTKYLKRLRVLVKSSISYAACGEYGKDYGRPHFHLVVWSHEPITPEQFSDAWSLDCKRTNDRYFVRPWRESEDIKDKEHGYFKFRIGRVEVFDLWANGSLNYDGKHPGVCKSQDASRNAMHNFTYLAKYIGKSDPETYFSKMPDAVRKRIQYAYLMLTKDIDALAERFPCPEEYHLSTYNHLTNSFHYDYQNYQGVDYFDFKKIVAPFFASSRRPSIGKHYFIQHRSRFLSQSYGLPSFMGKPIAFPAYFTRLLQQEKYPLRLRKNTPSGISLTKDLLPRLYNYMHQLHEDSRFWYTVRGYGKVSHGRGEPRFELYSLDGTDRNGTLDSVDFLDAQGGVIHYYYDPYHELFEGWRFDSSLKEYVFQDYYERLDFCDMVMSMIEQEYKDYSLKFSNIQKRFDLMNCILEDPETEQVKNVFVEQRTKMQTLYNISKRNYGL